MAAYSFATLGGSAPKKDAATKPSEHQRTVNPHVQQQPQTVNPCTKSAETAHPYAQRNETTPQKTRSIGFGVQVLGLGLGGVDSLKFKKLLHRVLSEGRAIGVPGWGLERHRKSLYPC